jgi:secreted PhoX family phosphatase
MPAALALAAGLFLAPALVVADPHHFDFGSWSEHLLASQSERLFGVAQPVGASSTQSIDAAAANQDPRRLVTLARGLRARVVASNVNVPPNVDMMALWPNDHAPTHIIACNEEGPNEPGVVRIRLFDGFVETMLTGLDSCDPVRRTAWGTIIVGEEAGSSGHLLEIVHPLAVTNVFFDRVANQTSGGTGAGNVADRPAVGRTSFEGIALYPNGVMYYGDENRPFQGTPGGAYFKFVPTSPWLGGGGIADLDESPLADGAVYGLKLGKRSGNTDNGQGSNTGLGTWVAIPTPVGDLRAAAAGLKLTGYYRPEDFDVDAVAFADGSIRFCGNNTGNEGQDRNWGETICVADGTLEEATEGTSTPEVQLFVVGTPELAMMDNMAYQPGRGNWVLMEDGDGPEVGRNNDLWSCLPDGADADHLSDGCIRIGTLNDLNAEWTGGFFDASGRHFFVSIQHNVTGHGVVLDVTGWR